MDEMLVVKFYFVMFLFFRTWRWRECYFGTHVSKLQVSGIFHSRIECGLWIKNKFLLDKKKKLDKSSFIKIEKQR